MILISRLPLSSPEAKRIKDWLIGGQRVIELVNAEIITLQAELSNDVVATRKYPNHENEGKDKLEQIGQLQIFLAVLDKYTKMESYSLVKLEPHHE